MTAERRRATSPSGQVDPGRDGDRERHLGVPVITVDEQDCDRDQADHDGADPCDAAQFHELDCGGRSGRQWPRRAWVDQIWVGLLVREVTFELRKLREYSDWAGQASGTCGDNGTKALTG